MLHCVVLFHQTLLPLGCCHVINYSSRYEDTWRCNFLGLHPSIALPSHVDLYVTVTITEPSIEGAETTPVDGADDPFLGYEFSVEASNDLSTSGTLSLVGHSAACRIDCCCCSSFYGGVPGVAVFAFARPLVLHFFRSWMSQWSTFTRRVSTH